MNYITVKPVKRDHCNELYYSETCEERPLMNYITVKPVKRDHCNELYYSETCEERSL